MRYVTAFALTSLLLATAPGAQARDEELCTALSNLMPLSSSKFKAIRGSQVRSDIWRAKLVLPGASKCEVETTGDDAQYECWFHVKAGVSLEATASNYADNIAACQPKWQRRNGDTSYHFITPNSVMQISIHSRHGYFTLNTD